MPKYTHKHIERLSIKTAFALCLAVNQEMSLRLSSLINTQMFGTVKVSIEWILSILLKMDSLREDPEPDKQVSLSYLNITYPNVGHVPREVAVRQLPLINAHPSDLLQIWNEIIFELLNYLKQVLRDNRSQDVIRKESSALKIIFETMESYIQNVFAENVSENKINLTQIEFRNVLCYNDGIQTR